jgi:hypothetical protein
VQTIDVHLPTRSSSPAPPNPSPSFPCSSTA